MYPRGDLSFSTLWGRGMEFDFGEWAVNFRDYPIPYLLAKDMHFFGIVIGAEEFEGTCCRLTDAIYCTDGE